MTTTVGLPSSQVWDLAGVPPSTLDYWVRTGLVTPSIRKSEGKRVERWWTIEEAVAVRVIRALRLSGAPLQTVRKAVRMIREWDRSVASAGLVWDGRDLLAVTDEGRAISVGNRQGQHAMLVLDMPVNDWMQQAEEAAEVVDFEHFRELREERRVRRNAQRERMKNESLKEHLGERDQQVD